MKVSRILFAGVVLALPSSASAALPSAAPATSGFAVSVADPIVPAARARVSDDGQLWVKGDVATAPAVPGNEWHRSLVGGGDATGRLLWGAPPGAGISVGHLTVIQNWNSPEVIDTWVVLFEKPAGPTGCQTELAASYTEQEIVFVTRERLSTAAGPSAVHLTFPIPLTVKASPVHGVCLYVATRMDAGVTANGISGAEATSFVVPTEIKTAP